MDARQRRGLAGSQSPIVSPQSDNNVTNKSYAARSYGCSRRGLRGNFVPPIRSKEGSGGNMTSRIGGKGDDALDDSTKRWLVTSKYKFVLACSTYSCILSVQALTSKLLTKPYKFKNI